MKDAMWNSFYVIGRLLILFAVCLAVFITQQSCKGLIALLLSLHAANSYILLTANLDDVHSLAKQIAKSPVVKGINDFIRRASSAFNEELPDVRKHNVEQIKTRSDLQLVENQAQRLRAHDSNEKTERSLPPSIMDKKSDAAPANDKDNLDVWTPNKEAVSEELNEKFSGSSSESENNDITFKPNYKMRRNVDDDIVKLGRNASFYLTSIKKIFENI